jgi:glutamine synthetase
MANICVEYVWLGGNNEVRSKTKVIQDKATGDFTAQELPIWNYDGSSTFQAQGHDSEVVIRPRKVIRDPFRKERNLIVLCDTYHHDTVTPHKDNTRVIAEKIFAQKPEDEPWFGIEQEYFLIDPATRLPLGFPSNGYPAPQGQYYCSAGASNNYGRVIAEEHLAACLYSGLDLTGINAEVAPGQHEYQVRAVGLDAGDQLWLTRYILTRVAENNKVDVSFVPKPVTGDWNGSGCHTNYSTVKMREGDAATGRTGLEVIEEALEKLSKKHTEHIAVYGTDNHMRLTGLHETSSMDTFSFGRANRGCSVRIPS